jgi:hypothetical protein
LISTVETLILGEGIKGFRIVVVICFGQPTPSKRQTIWQLSAGDEKFVPALKKTFYGTWWT